MYKLNYFNFKERSNNYLITNGLGKFAFISKADFMNLIQKKNFNNKEKFNELLEKKFVYNVEEEIFAEESFKNVRKQKNYLFSGTSLHIFVVTKNCNFNCVYCQAGNLNQKNSYNMSKEVAKEAVNIALQSPSDYLTFEFQGGEPLLNFDIIKYIVEYSKLINKEKYITYNLVSNLTLLTNEMIDFFIENDIDICTSIDGDKDIQNYNRPFAEKDSYEETIRNIKKLQKSGKNVNAIQTTTKYSLDKYKEIIDEYIKLGLKTVFLRPLTKLGKADENWKNVGYEAEEFLKFYKNSLDYIDKKVQEGEDISEGHRNILLKNINDSKPINYMELRSPCGGAIRTTYVLL